MVMKSLNQPASWFVVLMLCLGAASMTRGQDSWDCGDPETHMPPSPPTGCEWVYSTGAYSIRHVLVQSYDKVKSTEWEPLNPCACGWYPATVPCPSCTPDTISKTVTDTGVWAITTGQQQSHGFTLRSQLFADVGYSYNLTQTEQLSLTASHTESTTITLQRQQLLCFKRYYRMTWMERYRSRKMYADWTYSWRQWCGGFSTPTFATTTCAQLLAQGAFVWSTFPSFEWAPQAPPCGGIPIQNPDPWGGKRETPCCETVCVPPPPPAHPCCGCEYVP